VTHQPPPGSRRAARAAARAGEGGRARSGRQAPDGTGADGAAARPRSRWRTVRRTFYALVALGIIGPIAAFMVAYVLVSVPNPADLKTNQVATIFYDDGTSALSKIVPPEGNRTDVTIDKIPVPVRQAVLAAEDRSFYTNPGFSVTGTARAAINNLTGGDTQGGSTITQQYVKNALVGNSQTITRKLRELVISSKMARQSSKDDILAAYLNTIYFGRGAYGISAAAGAYFGKPVDQLTAGEGAVLASSIRSPSALDPQTNPSAAKDRWNVVLDAMVTQGWLTAADRAAQTYPRTVPPPGARAGAADGPEGLIANRVRQELDAAGISEQQLNTEGLQITTTVNQQNQQAAVTSAQQALMGQPPNLRSAVVSIDPRTGGVKAYYGGDQGSGFDFASSPNIQPGSSFKVFALAAALKQGVPLSKVYNGSSPQTIGGTTVANSEGASCGRCDLAEALKLSLNTVYFRLASDIGPQSVADIAHAAGIPKTIPGLKDPTLTEPGGAPPAAGIALGQYPVPVIDMAGAYSTLAANGMQRDPYFVQKVTASDGRVLLDRGARPSTQAVDPAIAQNVVSAMEPIAASSRNHQLAGGRQSAAKTGTAQLGDTGQNANGWMIGCTPSLCTASAVTTPDQTAANTQTGALVYGSGLPSDIWKATMDGALTGTPNETFPVAPPLNGDAGRGQSATRAPTPTVVQTPTPTPTPTTEAPPTTTTRAPQPTTTEAPPTTTTRAPQPTTTRAPVPTTLPPIVTIGPTQTTTAAPTG